MTDLIVKRNISNLFRRKNTKELTRGRDGCAEGDSWGCGEYILAPDLAQMYLTCVPCWIVKPDGFVTKAAGPERKKLLHLITCTLPWVPAEEELIKPFIFGPLKDFQGQIKTIMQEQICTEPQRGNKTWYRCHGNAHQVFLLPSDLKFPSLRSQRPNLTLSLLYWQ